MKNFRILYIAMVAMLAGSLAFGGCAADSDIYDGTGLKDAENEAVPSTDTSGKSKAELALDGIMKKINDGVRAAVVGEIQKNVAAAYAGVLQETTNTLDGTVRDAYEGVRLATIASLADTIRTARDGVPLTAKVTIINSVTDAKRGVKIGVRGVVLDTLGAANNGIRQAVKEEVVKSVKAGLKEKWIAGIKGTIKSLILNNPKQMDPAVGWNSVLQAGLPAAIYDNVKVTVKDTIISYLVKSGDSVGGLSADCDFTAMVVAENQATAQATCVDMGGTYDTASDTCDGVGGFVCASQAANGTKWSLTTTDIQAWKTAVASTTDQTNIKAGFAAAYTAGTMTPTTVSDTEIEAAVTASKTVYEAIEAGLETSSASAATTAAGGKNLLLLGLQASTYTGLATAVATNAADSTKSFSETFDAAMQSNGANSGVKWYADQLTAAGQPFSAGDANAVIAAVETATSSTVSTVYATGVSCLGGNIGIATALKTTAFAGSSQAIESLTRDITTMTKELGGTKQLSTCTGVYDSATHTAPTETLTNAVDGALAASDGYIYLLKNMMAQTTEGKAAFVATSPEGTAVDTDDALDNFLETPEGRALIVKALTTQGAGGLAQTASGATALQESLIGTATDPSRIVVASTTEVDSTGAAVASAILDAAHKYEGSTTTANSFANTTTLNNYLASGAGVSDAVWNLALDEALDAFLDTKEGLSWIAFGVLNGCSTADTACGTTVITNLASNGFDATLLTDAATNPTDATKATTAVATFASQASTDASVALYGSGNLGAADTSGAIDAFFTTATGKGYLSQGYASFYLTEDGQAAIQAGLDNLLNSTTMDTILAESATNSFTTVDSWLDGTLSGQSATEQAVAGGLMTAGWKSFWTTLDGEKAAAAGMASILPSSGNSYATTNMDEVITNGHASTVLAGRFSDSEFVAGIWGQFWASVDGIAAKAAGLDTILPSTANSFDTTDMEAIYSGTYTALATFFESDAGKKLGWDGFWNSDQGIKAKNAGLEYFLPTKENSYSNAIGDSIFAGDPAAAKAFLMGKDVVGADLDATVAPYSIGFNQLAWSTFWKSTTGMTAKQAGLDFFLPTKANGFTNPLGDAIAYKFSILDPSKLEEKSDDEAKYNAAKSLADAGTYAWVLRQDSYKHTDENGVEQTVQTYGESAEEDVKSGYKKQALTLMQSGFGEFWKTKDGQDANAGGLYKHYNQAEAIMDLNYNSDEK